MEQSIYKNFNNFIHLNVKDLKNIISEVLK